MMSRECARCGEMAETVPGRAICRPCKRAKDLEYHRANRDARIAKMREYAKTYTPSEKALEYRKRYREEHAEQYREHQRRARAARQGVQVAVIPGELVEAKIAYWGGRCWMCGTSEIKDMDHVKPVTSGGPHLLANLRPACVTCNRSKGARWPFSMVS